MAEEENDNDVVAELADLSLPSKKKKKKKKPVDFEATDDVEVAPAGQEEEPAVVAADDDDDDKEVAELADLAFPSKKKKKKKKRTDMELAEEADGAPEGQDDEEVEDNAAEDEPTGTGLPWDSSDRDYHYEELLDRVFGILRENNPELAGEKRRTIMKPPQVLREGTKKTVFVNFMELCKTMHRQPDHVMAFLLAELGTSGSLDGQQRLIVKGRFLPKVFEGILRRYVNEYVMCNGCKSPDTILSKENRLFFLRCEQCGCSRSVAPIKAGFVARVGRRKATPG
eukprot:jgi/Chlat1/6822/Chrsp51S06505